MAVKKHSSLENSLRKQGFRLLAGTDEAGRGPLAGPVVAAVCLIPEGVCLKGIQDSKALTPKVRKELYWQIVTKTLVAVGIVDEREIDRINILQASLLAMRKAILALSLTPDVVLIDGPFKTNLPLYQVPVIRGDEKLISVGAASIVAKVTRDELMDRYDTQYPAYGFKMNKGYATEAHLAALEAHGPSPIHRMTFRPLFRFNAIPEYEH